MATNKTVPTKISVTDFITAIPDEAKRADAKALVKLIQAATAEKPKMWGPSIIGFGSYHYIYDTGREGDSPVVAFSPRKAAIVFYGLRSADDVEASLAKLGKHTTNGGCVYVKKLADVDQTVLKTMIVKSAAVTRKQHKA